MINSSAASGNASPTHTSARKRDQNKTEYPNRKSDNEVVRRVNAN